MHLHILGICGTLMGSIALLARAEGHKVTGSDENVYPPMSDQLQQAGIEVNSPYTASNIPTTAELVIIGNANLPRGNEAVEYVLDNNIPYTSGAEFLGRYLLNDKWVIAISGTHGKTTTSSMVAWILEYAGLNPGYLIGGIPGNFAQSARLGGNFFVIEADEYDTSYFDRRSKFLHYQPRTLVINNLEFDHADIFENLAAIQNQFHLLLRTIPSTGLIIYPENDNNIDAVIERGCWSEKLPIGNQCLLDSRSLDDSGQSFEILLKGKTVATINWQLTGQHNINNALAAIAATRHIGITPTIAAEALCQFEGVKRRMEKIFETSDLTVFDDFAHHPTAITTTLEGLRKAQPNSRILAIVEPGSHTMRKGTHAKTLAKAVTAADDCLWHQPSTIKWQMDDFLASEKIFTDIEALLSTCESMAPRYDYIVIMSNSGFGGFQQRLVARLAQ